MDIRRIPKKTEYIKLYSLLNNLPPITKDPKALKRFKKSYNILMRKIIKKQKKRGFWNKKK